MAPAKIETENSDTSGTVETRAVHPSPWYTGPKLYGAACMKLYTDGSDIYLINKVPRSDQAYSEAAGRREAAWV